MINENNFEREAVAAFRKYARYGYDKMELSFFELCDSARGAAPSRESAAQIAAVYMTLKALENFSRQETADAVRNVYFSYADRPLKKNEISWRVRRFASEGYMDERTVYRHLRVAKTLFSKFYQNGIKNIK